MNEAPSHSDSTQQRFVLSVEGTRTATRQRRNARALAALREERA